MKFADTNADWLALPDMGIWLDLQLVWEGHHSLMSKYCTECMRQLVQNITFAAEDLKREDDQTSVMKRVILHGLREQILDKLDAQ